MTKPLIVGIDIGTTSGLAIYDLDRNLVYLESKRNVSISNIINQITAFGDPVIIATDKKIIPSSINKIAASFNCRVFHPDHDLSVKEKEDIAKIPTKDDHERDALAAATFAFKSYAAQFLNIQNTLESLGLSYLSDKVKKMIINREAKNIAEAIEMVKPKEEIKSKEIVKETNLNWKEKAIEYKKSLKREKYRYEILRYYSEKLEEKLNDLEKQKQKYLEEEMKKNEKARENVLREREMKKRDILIRQLKFELGKQKNFRETYEEEFKKQEELKEIEEENLIPVIILSDFTVEYVVDVNSRFNIKDKVVWIKNFKSSIPALKALISFKPKIVLAELEDETKKRLKNSGIIAIDELKPEVRRFYGILNSKELEDSIKKTEKKDFLNWLDEYRKR